MRIASIMAPPVLPPNAGLPVAISYSRRPSAKTSARGSKSSPRTCTGDMYAGVPLMMPTIEMYYCVDLGE